MKNCCIGGNKIKTKENTCAKNQVMQNYKYEKNYTMEESKEQFDAENTNSDYEEVAFIQSKFKIKQNFFPWIRETCFKVKRKDNKDLFVFRIQNVNSKGKLNILFSSDGIKDLGSSYSFLIDLCTQFKIDIWAYEYSKKTDKAIKSDILELSKFINKITDNQTEFLLLGHSFGSIPNIHLATYKNCEIKIKAVVLISPVGAEINKNKINCKNYSDSIFNKISVNSLSSLTCPVFLIHGQNDKFVKYIHTVNMGRKFRNLFEWYPKKADHLNIVTEYRTKLYSKLKLFIQQLYVNGNYKIKSKISKNNFSILSLNMLNNQIIQMKSLNNNYSLKTTAKTFSLKFEDNFIYREEKRQKEESTQFLFEPLTSERLDTNNETIHRKSTRSTIKSDICPFERNNYT